MPMSWSKASSTESSVPGRLGPHGRAGGASTVWVAQHRRSTILHSSPPGCMHRRRGATSPGSATHPARPAPSRSDGQRDPGHHRLRPRHPPARSPAERYARAEGRPAQSAPHPHGRPGGFASRGLLASGPALPARSLHDAAVTKPSIGASRSPGAAHPARQHRRRAHSRTRHRRVRPGRASVTVSSTRPGSLGVARSPQREIGSQSSAISLRLAARCRRPHGRADPDPSEMPSFQRHPVTHAPTYRSSRSATQPAERKRPRPGP